LQTSHGSCTTTSLFHPDKDLIAKARSLADKAIKNRKYFLQNVFGSIFDKHQTFQFEMNDNHFSWDPQYSWYDYIEA
jgi:hypothetical protein